MPASVGATGKSAVTDTKQGTTATAELVGVAGTRSAYEPGAQIEDRPTAGY